ncbi:hypothetical protein quinque_008861 [Culex quinquefasciatus]
MTDLILCASATVLGKKPESKRLTSRLKCYWMGRPKTTFSSGKRNRKSAATIKNDYPLPGAELTGTMT